MLGGNTGIVTFTEVGTFENLRLETLKLLPKMFKNVVVLTGKKRNGCSEKCEAVRWQLGRFTISLRREPGI